MNETRITLSARTWYHHRWEVVEILDADPAADFVLVRHDNGRVRVVRPSALVEIALRKGWELVEFFGYAAHMPTRELAAYPVEVECPL